MKGKSEDTTDRRREFHTMTAATAAVPLAAGAEPGDPARPETPRKTKRGEKVPPVNFGNRNRS